mmetsp:Transcript_55420/g.135774  ORF Transcript_55420/g.135774 Transcript_55420/m.135774 type:complete len:218 (-) Transcript_55420:488-1141(-)
MLQQQPERANAVIAHIGHARKALLTQPASHLGPMGRVGHRQRLLGPLNGSGIPRSLCVAERLAHRLIVLDHFGQALLSLRIGALQRLEPQRRAWRNTLSDTDRNGPHAGCLGLDPIAAQRQHDAAAAVHRGAAQHLATLGVAQRQPSGAGHRPTVGPVTAQRELNRGRRARRSPQTECNETAPAWLHATAANASRVRFSGASPPARQATSSSMRMPP